MGLEAVLIDHDTMTVEAIEPSDGRSIDVEVAGVGGLLVAKVHKINDRLVTGRPDRLIDKDAADIFRIMQTASPRQVGTTLASLRHSALAGQVTDTALRHLAVLFGRRAGEGVGMAQRALRTAVPEEQVSALCTSFTERLVAAVGH